MSELTRLPSLLALLYLEAAVRHANFTRAARELNVTQSAVSHQIKALEEELGAPLFERTAQGVRPTAAAHVLAQAIEQGFGHVAACIDDTFAQNNESIQDITIGAPPSLANLWLVTRLAHFHQTYPGWSLRPLVGLQYHDLENGEVDAGLRYGMGVYPELASVMLCAERLVAVCAPQLWSERSGQEALAKLPILEAYTASSPRNEPPSRYWARRCGVELGETVIAFNRQSMAVMAAIEGQGLAIVPWQIARDALQRNVLIQPVPDEAPDQMSYYLVWHPKRAAAAKIERLTDWLRAQLTP